MFLALPKKFVDRLIGLPESGMGYQLVDVQLRDGRQLQGLVVLNAELLEVPDSEPSVDPEDIEDLSPSAKAHHAE